MIPTRLDTGVHHSVYESYRTYTPYNSLGSRQSLHEQLTCGSIHPDRGPSFQEPALFVDPLEITILDDHQSCPQKPAFSHHGLRWFSVFLFFLVLYNTRSFPLAITGQNSYSEAKKKSGPDPLTTPLGFLVPFACLAG